MPRSALGIMNEAMAAAKVGQVVAGAQAGYTQIALNALNSVLDFLSETVDFARATKQFFFTFAPNLVTLGGGNIITAAANPLPIDYQRVQTSGGSTGAQRSTKWYLQGVPYDMVELDLTEWDDQVMQAGIQSYPYFCAKDMSGGAIQINFQGDLNSGSTLVQNVSSINPLTGAITPISTAVPLGLINGMTIAGGIGPITPIVPGTTITNLNPPANTITLSQVPNYLNGSNGSSWVGVMPQASLMAGYSANLLIYPPPSGAFNAMIRYQSYMPPLTQAQVNAGAACWFPEDNTLIDFLSKRLMAIADDSRMPAYHAYVNEQLGRYRQLVDDRANRAQTTQMDRRTFGKNFNYLPKTKVVGWLVLACMWLGGAATTFLC